MQHFPKGNRYTSLEKNLLKLRAFEMVLVLFRVQQLRGFVLETVRNTRKLDEALEAESPGTPEGGGTSSKEVVRVLVEDGILTTKDASELEDLIDFRNLIAHETERITVDLNRDFQGQFSRLPELQGYKPGALETLDRIEAKIKRGFRAKYVMSLSLKPVMFQAAEKTYREEIQRLRRKIGRQIARWNQEIEAVNANIASIPGDLLNRFQPGHPEHKTQSGNLTKSGVECCYALFETGATPLSMACLMQISLQAARRRFAQWQHQNSRAVQED